jgi:hypothetical protein
MNKKEVYFSSFMVILIILIGLISCKKDSDSYSVDELRKHCSTAYTSPDDSYIRIINTLDVNIIIDYDDLPYSTHMWAKSCELLGVFANEYSAIIITQCETGGADVDGGPEDCGSGGSTVRISYYLEPSETFEIIVDSDTFE